MVRTAFLVDGFNLYHSLREAAAALRGAHTRWLDLRSLCASYLAEVGGGAELHRLIYFSALATHREAIDPNVTARHRAYLECLRATGVEVELGHFKTKLGWCPNCGREIVRHEEKETDVAIGVSMLDLMWLGECDAVVLVTGDSDLAPAVRLARARFPGRRMLSLFPYRRISFELRALVHKAVRIRAERYARHQLPNPCPLPNGRTIVRPRQW